MPSGIPLLTIRFPDGPQRFISCAADAVKVLSDERWPNKRETAYREALRVIGDAMAGHCSPTAALGVFRKLAKDAGVLVKTPVVH